MSLSMSDAARFLALELRVAELERQVAELVPEAPRRGRPPKNLEERMKNQEHDPIDA